MMLPEFLFHQFFTYGKRGRFNAIVNRVSIAHLTREKLVTIPFTVPPIEEQKAICRWISDECQPLDDAIARTEEEIKWTCGAGSPARTTWWTTRRWLRSAMTQMM